MSLLRKFALIVFALVSWNAGAWAASGYEPSINQLRIAMAPFTNVVVGGYYNPGDNGGGTFVGVQLGNPPVCLDNGGTIIYNSTSNTCYYRTSSNYGPKEFGARGVSGGGTDDSVAIQRWLTAIQPHIGDVDTYEVSQTLICNAETVQGPSNFDSGGALFVLQAILPTSGGYSDGLVQAESHCHLSGVVLDGNNITTPIMVNTNNAYRVVIDGSSALMHGRPNNLLCDPNNFTGLIVKDSELIGSSGDNVVINCPNVRLVGDVITSSGGEGVTATANDLTIANGAIWGNHGNGVYLNGVFQVSIVGMDFNQNGQTLGDAAHGYGAAIFFEGTTTEPNMTVSVCANHFKDSAGANTDATHGGHIYFDGTSSDISFCGNTYTDLVPSGSKYPNYVYDSSSSVTLNPAAFYENPPLQNAPIASDQTIYSIDALTTVEPWQVVPTSGRARAARRAGPRVKFPIQKQPSGYTGSW